MAFPTAVNDQITDSVTRAHTVGGDKALKVIAELIAGIAKGLEGAKQGNNTIEEVSIALEAAEMALHEIVASLATGRE